MASCLLDHVSECVTEAEVQALRARDRVKLPAGDRPPRTLALGLVAGDQVRHSVGGRQRELAVRVVVGPRPWHIESGEVDAEPEALRTGECFTSPETVNSDAGTGCEAACSSVSPLPSSRPSPAGSRAAASASRAQCPDSVGRTRRAIAPRASSPTTPFCRASPAVDSRKHTPGNRFPQLGRTRGDVVGRVNVELGRRSEGRQKPGRRP